MSRPSIDAEMIEVALAYLEACGLQDSELVLNSTGDAKCRPAYVETLRAALRKEAGRLCADCQRRTETNPLRVLDCKVPEDQPIIDALPKIGDHLCDDCRDHFAEVRRELDLLGIRYRLDHRLVRGLDYYTRTTFEVTSGALGSQNSVLGGGRYDGLVKELGGPDLTGIGFALGMERLVMLIPAGAGEPRCDAFLAVLVPKAFDRDLLIQHDLREAGVRVLMDHEGRGLKSQMKKADRLGARYVAMMGEDELADDVWTVRDMTTSSQERVSDVKLAEYLEEKIRGRDAG
jgi:histidyl-tRNA synthetase